MAIAIHSYFPPLLRNGILLLIGLLQQTCIVFGFGELLEKIPIIGRQLRAAVDEENMKEDYKKKCDSLCWGDLKWMCEKDDPEVCLPIRAEVCEPCSKQWHIKHPAVITGIVISIILVFIGCFIGGFCLGKPRNRVQPSRA